jgi:hypothetical protein
LIGRAGMVLGAVGGQIEMPGDVMFGEDDSLTLAERWLRKSIELAPPGAEFRPSLAQIIHIKGNRTLDPKEKVRLLRESLTYAGDYAKPEISRNLMAAEFDAGDDDAAARDAESLLASAPKNASAYNAAQTILGRVAAAKGDLIEAKSRMMASLSFKNGVFEPNFTLAQDIYDAGDHEAVIAFLEATRPVWKFDRGRIDRMISFVKKAPSVDLVQLSRQLPGSEVIRRPAPAFEAQDADGRTWTREQLAGRVVALEFGNAPLAEKVARDRGAVLLRIQDDDTRRRFEVLTSPTVVVIDKQGTVSAFRAGPATEPEWRTDFETGFGTGANPTFLPTPKLIYGERLAWEPVENAESYVVEWDVHDDKGWEFDHEGTVRVIATRETSTTLDLKGFTRVRWRVYAVPKTGQPGKPSVWREIDGIPVTKIYK